MSDTSLVATAMLADERFIGYDKTEIDKAVALYFTFFKEVIDAADAGREAPGKDYIVKAMKAAGIQPGHEAGRISDICMALASIHKVTGTNDQETHTGLS